MKIKYLRISLYLLLLTSANAYSSLVFFNDSETDLSDTEIIIVDTFISLIDQEIYTLTFEETSECIAEGSCFDYIGAKFPESRILQYDYFKQNDITYLIFSLWDHDKRILLSTSSIECDSCSTLQFINEISDFDFTLMNAWNEEQSLVIRPSLEYSYNQPEVNFDEKYFTIEINPTPSARVTINGNDYGMSPVEISSTEKKSIDLVLETENYETFTKKLRFGKDKKIKSKLKELVANLRIDSSPSGATVYINGSKKGRTPTDIKKIAMSDSLDIKIELKNYIEYEFNFTPIKSGDNYEKVNLERGQGYLRILPASGYSTDKISIKVNGKNRGTLRNLTNSYEWNESRKILTLDAGKNNLEVTYDGDNSVVRKNSVTIVTDETFDEIWDVNFQESVDVTITF
jgi:hypothetical protein